MQPLIQVEYLVKRYSGRGVLGSGEVVSALNEVSFSVAPGKTLALVGASGSGKSTLALCLACLERPTSGRIWFEGRDIAALDEKQLRAVRPQIQLVFQDPASSLNPRFTALEIVTEPLLVQRKWGTREMHERALALLERIGLSRDMASRRTGEFSGGQRQRLAMAAHLGDEIAVMNRGRIVEQGVPEKVLRAPSHEATRCLAAATPGSIVTPRMPGALR